jgi:hypothetical protein
VLERLRYSESETRLYHLHYNGVIGKIGNDNYIFAYGETDDKSKRFTGLDCAVMFGKINWEKLIRTDKTLSSVKDLDLEEAIKVLNDKQLNNVIQRSVSNAQLIVSMDKAVTIRNGYARLFDYQTLPTTRQFIITETYKANEDITYRSEIISHLKDHVRTRLKVN